MPNDTTLTYSQDGSEQQNQDSSDIWQRMADFIVNAEFSRQTNTNNPYKMQEIIQDKSQRIDRQLSDIRSELKHFNAIMSRAGATQWRHESERMLAEGKQEIHGLEQTYHGLKTAISSQCEQLNRSSMNTVKTVSQLVSSARTTTIKKLNEEKTMDLKETCDHNLQEIDHVIKSFQWKNLVLTLLLSLLVSTIISLYIDDQWPWQMHSEVAKEREAGKILLNSWTQLSHNDQDTIIENA